MLSNFDVSTNISRFAFVFLIYVLISSGYIAEILSCQMRKLLTTSPYFRHIFAIVMLFAFIMFEGGWDFDKSEEDKASNNWASGNTIHTLIIAILIYIVFLISSKSKLLPNLIFFGLLFILYMTNTYREYLLQRDKISKETNNNVLIIEKIISIASFIVLFYGFIEYYMYQKQEYGKDFSWKKFILGTQKCKSIPK
jgi:hypothetical protein